MQAFGVSNRLSIRRWSTTLHLPEQHDSSDSVRNRLDLLCRTSLVDSLRTELARRLNATDASVWFIRRLELDVACNLGIADSSIADQLSGVLMRAIRAALSRGASGDTEIAIRFESKADYLASFFFDLVEGTARGLWYYAEFESLFALPDGSVILQTLRKHPELTDEVLTALARSGRWKIVSRILSSSQCQQLLALLKPELTMGTTSVDLLLKTWLSSGQPRKSQPEEVLNLYLAARVANAGPAGVLRQVCPVLLEYLQWCEHSTGRSSPDASTQFLRLVELLGISGARDLCSALVPAVTPQEQFVEIRDSRSSELAGLCLAWSAFVSTDVSRLVSDQKLLRFLLATRLAGKTRQRTAEVDPIPLLFADLETAPSTQERSELTLGEKDLCELFRSILNEQHRRRWLGGHLIAERIRLPECGRPVLLFREMHSNAWVYATDGNRSATDAIGELRQWWPTTDQFTVLFEGNQWMIPRSELVPGVSVQFFDGSDSVELGSPEPQPARKLRSAKEELSYLSATDTLSLSTELLVLLLSRLTLQAFANRLPGFARSSPAWLGRNLLGSSGRLTRAEDGAIQVQLEPPPLHLVLRMGGWDTDSFRLHSGQQVHLCLSSP